MTVDKKFGETVRKYRQMKGMTQLELALAIGKHNKAAVSRIELGSVAASVDTAQKIANALGVSVLDLTREAMHEDKEAHALRFLPYLLKADETTLHNIELILGMK